MRTIVSLLTLFFFLVSPVHAATLTFTWTDTSSNEVGFQMERQCDGTLGFSDVGASVGANVTTMQLTQPQDSICSYRLRAFNPAGRSGPSNEVVANTWTVPNAPSGLVQTASVAVAGAKVATVALNARAKVAKNTRAITASNQAVTKLTNTIALVATAERALGE